MKYPLTEHASFTVHDTQNLSPRFCRTWNQRPISPQSGGILELFCLYFALCKWRVPGTKYRLEKEGSNFTCKNGSVLLQKVKPFVAPQIYSKQVLPSSWQG